MRKILLTLIFLLLYACVSGFFCPYAHAAVPREPSLVYVLGKQLILEKKREDGLMDKPRPYIIRGITWLPATRAPEEGPDPFNPSEKVQYGFFFDWPGRDPQGHTIFNYWLRSQYVAHYRKDIPLIKQLNVNTVRVYNDFGNNPEITNKILDDFYKNNIMVIMSVAGSKEDIDSKRYIKVVNMCKNHPAILMWLIGNEWNLEYNKFWGYDAVEDAAAAVNNIAKEISQIDSFHPVASCLGDRFSDKEETKTVGSIVRNCPYVEIWGFNIYRGKSFYCLFDEWKAISGKPMFISEFGIDSYETKKYKRYGDWLAYKCSGAENQDVQTEYDIALWREIIKRLSAVNPSEQCLGGIVHTFNDMLWKSGSYHISMGEILDYNDPVEGASYDDYNPEGYYIPGAAPDNVLNEEYFGLVDADRKPKKAYWALQQYYDKLDKLQPKQK